LLTLHSARVYAHPSERTNRRPWLRRALRAILLALHDSRRRMALRILRDYSHLLDRAEDKPRR